ncbi:GTP cyclohydrolase II [Mycolicibacterium canariasense]|uniref:GTP cyclohydrolase II n=1 Tax=Mycolicibacterium canariasense TaxID=228230 RepID=A0A100WBG3_MYCCR|nr:YciI family protein [Mycolicibacterium canariasense]MCV7209403.1 GTP cyclohydrolase [Mycolicibacterium canariasense]ORV05783.1 GTP cyclohydrolase [Mycolicibacterium canariasense]GAS95061.1 GTP cyclohydrolase II [Mycolicibacterium canariasense]
MFHVLTLTYLQPDDIVDRTRPAHLDWLAAEVAAGRVLLAGRTEARGAVLVVGDMSAAEADAVIAGDPYTQAGLARYDRVSFTAGFRASGL